jgi:hypothetical protein
MTIQQTISSKSYTSNEGHITAHEYSAEKGKMYSDP